MAPSTRDSFGRSFHRLRVQFEWNRQAPHLSQRARQFAAAVVANDWLFVERTKHELLHFLGYIWTFGADRSR